MVKGTQVKVQFKGQMSFLLGNEKNDFKYILSHTLACIHVPYKELTFFGFLSYTLSETY